MATRMKGLAMEGSPSMRTRRLPRLVSVVLSVVAAFEMTSGRAVGDDPGRGRKVLSGRDALGDWTTDAPGVRRRIDADDLPAPFDTPSAENSSKVIRRPEGAWPEAPGGFKVTEFATGLTQPRVIVTAPNGDLFVAKSRAG